MNYIQIFADKFELLEPFSMEERGELLTAMMIYSQTGDEMQMQTNARYIWPVFRQMLDANRRAYESKAAAGAKDSKQKQAEAKQSKANNPIIQESRIKNQETYINSPSNEGEKRKRFSAPTADDVAAYAKAQGYKLDAQRFVDFYASKGWKVGSSPMKDWKAAVRTWANRDSSSPPARAGKIASMHESQYEQREYNNSEDALDRLMEGWTG